jgi:S-DNA-T family DNA segregation ATPase FtsK/SpoIIIE
MAGRMKDRSIGISLVAFSIFLGLSLLTYDKWDPSFFTYTVSAPKNLAGAPGALVADLFITLFGLMSFAFPVFLTVKGIKGYLLIPGHKVHLAGAALLVLTGSFLFAMMQASFRLEYGAGGILGDIGSTALIKVLTLPWAYVITWGLFMGSLILLSPIALINFFLKPESSERKLPEAAPEATPEDGVIDIEATIESPDNINDETVEPRIMLGDEPNGPNEIDEGVEVLDVNAPLADDSGNDEGDPVFIEGAEPIEDEDGVIGAIPTDPSPLEEGVEHKASKTRKRKKKYIIPELNFLHIYDPPVRRSKEDFISDSKLLEAKLMDFNVKGRVTQVHPGPIVTMNEFEPAPGVKINRVVSLSDDLALALKAPSVRISAVPGTSALGIEVPNHDRETVALKDLIASDNFTQSESHLPMAFGKDIFGAPVIADLARMPHLLVAGATGSGKSVFMNALVVSILYKAKPDEVKMLMIDPKLLELSVYDGIPHLVAPVVTNPKDASEMLRRMVFEMERRYRLLAEKGVRNIEGYNTEVSEEEKLPYIVVFIDELADLMLSSAAQVEDSIARLAQMARASGIHLVIATQRPSVDVITGVIKANFPARVAFQVTSRVDSRTIIDTQGAEQLIGRGDMLFMLPGKRLLRVHGALVTETEVKSIVSHVKSQGEPDYTIMQAIAEAQENERVEAEYSEDRDEHYWKAVEHGEALGEASISSIQRKLRIGYNRAARIMELLEEDGMVGPPKGAGKPRDFLGRNMR